MLQTTEPIQALRVRLDEAIKYERWLREVAFVDGLNERIAGFEAVPLTMRIIVDLKIVKSPFIVGGVPDVGNTCQFLWRVSPKYGTTWRHRLIKISFEKRCWSEWSYDLQGFIAVVQAVQDYTLEAYFDSPSSSSSSWRKNFFSEAAGVCDTFANAYGWDVKTTMNTPLKQLFQLAKPIRARQMVKAKRHPILFNPSDKIMGELVAAEFEAETNGKSN